MATASSAPIQRTTFSAALGNNELTLELDEQQSQLVIELASASRVVLYKKVVIKPEEIREITG